MPVTKILDIGTTLPEWSSDSVAVCASVRECPSSTQSRPEQAARDTPPQGERPYEDHRPRLLDAAGAARPSVSLWGGGHPSDAHAGRRLVGHAHAGLPRCTAERERYKSKCGRLHACSLGS